MSYFSRIGKTELIDLFISLIVLIIAFSMVGERRLPSVDVVMISAVGVGAGFLLHELAHKFVAQRYGYLAEYKASWSGLIFMIIMSFMGFILAAPGAVVIRKDPYAPAKWNGSNSSSMADPLERNAIKEELWIALAGPMTNIVLMILFLILVINSRMANGLMTSAAYFAFYINLILAAFNLIPFDPFDGGKIIRGSPLTWAIVAIPTMLIAIPIYFGIRII